MPPDVGSVVNEPLQIVLFPVICATGNGLTVTPDDEEALHPFISVTVTV